MTTTRPETAEDRLLAAQKASAEARAVADQAERAVSEERQRLAAAAAERQQAWAKGVVAENDAKSQEAASAVASARENLGRAITGNWPGAADAYLAWRFAASDANHQVARLSRAAADLGMGQPQIRFPYKDLGTLAEVAAQEMATAVRVHDLEREDALSEELDAVGAGRWEEPFNAHLTGCPGGPVEVMTSTRPGPVREVRRGGRTSAELGPATTLTTRRCQVCGGQTVEQV